MSSVYLKPALFRVQFSRAIIVPAGTQFETIYLGGGGAYYVEHVVRQSLPDCHIVRIAEPEYANMCGYAELAASLDEERWEGN